MIKRLFRGDGSAHRQPDGVYRFGNDRLIEMRDVIKTFQTAAGPFTALKSIDLEVDHGEFVAVIGKSGSGKSTLINMLTGIDRPTSGEVFVGDIAVHTLSEGKMAEWRGRNIGVVFQFFQLLPTLTVAENVMLPMDFCGMYSLRERKSRAIGLLELVEMENHAGKLPATLSGGQQQRVAIARALANDPPILVADEPTGNLDSKTAESVFRLFEKLADDGKTILMVTHDNDLAKRALRTIILSDGEVVDEYLARALPSLNQDQLARMTRRAELLTFSPGEVIVEQGSAPDKFYVITTGEVDVILEHGEGHEIVVECLGSGQYFGEIALLRGGQRTATVRARSNSAVEVLAIDPTVFRDLLSESSATRDLLDRVTDERIDELEELVEEDSGEKQDDQPSVA